MVKIFWCQNYAILRRDKIISKKTHTSIGKSESMLHKFKTNTLDTLREEVFIDGERIRCTDYVLRHSAGEVATLDNSLLVENDIVSECEVRIKKQRTICKTYE